MTCLLMYAMLLGHHDDASKVGSETSEPRTEQNKYYTVEYPELYPPGYKYLR